MNGIPISWKQVRGDDRGRQQAQYIMELLLGGLHRQAFYPAHAGGYGGEQLHRYRRHGVSGSEPGSMTSLGAWSAPSRTTASPLSLMQLDGIYAVRLTVDGRLPEDRTNEVYTSGEVLLQPGGHRADGEGDAVLPQQRRHADR